MARKFFFWEDKLHKVLRVDRPGNLVDAWRFEDGRVVTLLYTDYKMNAGKAIRHSEAAKLIRLKPDTLNRYILRGKIRPPERSYDLNGDRQKGWQRWWSEKNMLELHDYLMTVHKGSPRKDGQITPMQHLPSRAEIVAAFNESQKVFVRTADGTEIPLFRSNRR